MTKNSYLLSVIMSAVLSLFFAPTLLAEEKKASDEEITALIQQKYTVKWTNLNTTDFSTINYLVTDPALAEQDIQPFYERKPWKINEPIIIEFKQPILQGDFQGIYFVADSVDLQLADANGLLGLSLSSEEEGLEWTYQQVLSISPDLFYHSHLVTSGARKLLNFPLDTTYSIYVKFYVSDDYENKIRQFRLLTFKTPAVELFSELDTAAIELDDTWQSALTSQERKNLKVSQALHGKESVQENLRTFSGKGVSIALFDDGIKQQSRAHSRVRFKLKNIPDSLLGSDASEGAKHGTLMANFLTDYAPSVELLDFNAFPYLQHVNKKLALGFQKYALDIFDYAGLAQHLGVDLMNVSLVSPRLSKRNQQWISAIMQGLVISKSVGNNRAITHLISQESCTDPTHFIPYFARYDDIDLSQAEGALVILQAALKTDNGYISVRSQAGDAAPYTLSVLETERGASSQAAATFSGIFALIKEAANTYNRNYSNKQLVELLFETADDIGEPGVDAIYGHGLVNINRALEEIERGYAPSVSLYRDIKIYEHTQEIENIYQNGC